ncbi:hypothetical protein T4A_13969 [Trichinella pseudospiralis]|uniref:Uncharacterized protein n=1 Tax=Trichinella pseudospiralis TaxID=6337 RepID=A0A0V1DM62_TRIPS|nr:hypothetical protein T4A_13969 [Trichinella pseudospiralis]
MMNVKLIWSYLAEKKCRFILNSKSIRMHMQSEALMA